jgi:hypothetical protein
MLIHIASKKKVLKPQNARPKKHQVLVFYILCHHQYLHCLSPKQKSATALNGNKSRTSGEELSSDDKVVDVTNINKGGREGGKAALAFKQFHPVPAVKDGLPVWLWQCKWWLW